MTATRRVFVTGTDTNVGKTVITALLAAHLSTTGRDFRALKPFCSGERTDAFLLTELQGGLLSADEVNPFYFPEPVSPWTAARRAGPSVSIEQAVNFFWDHARESKMLLIEGAGGLLSPLGEKFDATDLIVRLEAEVIVVAANRLGVLNHSRLTIEALRLRGVKKVKIVLVDPATDTLAVRSNEADLRALLPETPVFRIPFLSSYSPDANFIRDAAKELHAILEELVR